MNKSTMRQAEAVNLTKIPELNLPWVDSPFFDKLLERANLDAETKKQVKHFAEYGYLIIDPEIENFDKLADRVIEGLDPYYIDPGRIQDAWIFNDGVKAIAIAPKILSLLRILYQREPIPFQTLNFPRGTEQYTHSDSIHFSSVPARFMCGVWVALEDIDLNNGPLHYYPGSQKLPIFDLNDLGINASDQKHPYENYFIYEDFIQAAIAQYKLQKVDVILRKGQALVWAANLLHGGSPILDLTRSRHSQVTHFYFSDCMYYTPLLSDPFIKKIYVRTVKNILTGKVVPHYYNGRRVSMANERNLRDLLGERENELARLKTHIDKIKEELERVRANITFMENSRFWKLRNQWFEFKKALGLVKDI